MKKVLATLTMVALLGLGTAAFAHTWGGGYGYGYMQGYGPMMGYFYGDSDALDETAGLRRDINTKRFEYAEALRSGDRAKAGKLEKELDTLYGKLARTAPRGANYAGYGCW